MNTSSSTAWAARACWPRRVANDCSKITSRFERDVLRNLWDPARAALGMPTRRKSRSRTFPIILERQGVVENVNIDPAEFGVPLTFTHFEAPAHLSGRAYNSGIVLSGETTHFLPDKKHFENAIYAKFKPEKATYSFSYKPTNFARFLAKIAYGFVIARWPRHDQDSLRT